MPLQTGQMGEIGIFCPNLGVLISTNCFVVKQASPRLSIASWGIVSMVVPFY
jgi:hypothetical protein